MNKVNLLYIDLFCGAGGTSTGINSARIGDDECAKVIACVNHDAKAIASHAFNHPDAMHFTEDIRTLELSPLVSHLQKCRAEYPGALTVLWASLECTNFSKAKGGQPRDADSRTLAEHLFRYIEALDPDYIQIENVEEFMSWGDVDENGKPLSKDKGRCYLRWIKNVKKYGYVYEYKIMNAADYGAYTSRKRFFGIFAKTGLPIAWPEQSHCKGGSDGSLFEDLKKWKPVKDVLDLSLEGESIFTRKKPLAENTLERIYSGLIKHVAGGRRAYEAFAGSVKLLSDKHGEMLYYNTGAGRASMKQQEKVYFLSRQFSGDPYSKNKSIDEPAGAITCIDHHALISVHCGNGYNRGVDVPAPALTTKDKLTVVNVNFIASEYSNGQVTSLDTVCPAVLTNPKQKLVTVKQFLMNPQFSSPGSSLEDPCFTLIARMDKRPPYLITTESGDVAIKMCDTDSPAMKKIKRFMALYCIIDIKMRMLMVEELKLITGFPKDYVLFGNQSDQKKFIGNAVEVTLARKWCEALCVAVRKHGLSVFCSNYVA